MAHLAIKGHTIRGKEVIKILETLGGKNSYGAMGNAENASYFIHDNAIQFWNNDDLDSSSFIIFTLEEFLEKFPYKIGDKVVVTAGKDIFIDTIGEIKWEEKINTILYVLQNIKINVYPERLQFYIEETVEKKADTSMAPILKSEDYSDRKFGYKIPKGYEFDCIKENEIIIKPVKPQYPKTYEECCKVLGCEPNRQSVTGYYAELIEDFQKLLICRDAYWKIAREQMKLDEPWNNTGKNIYIIGTSYDRKIIKDFFIEPSFKYTFSFPTMEMQNAFYENFKDLIEDCKELL